MAVLALGLLGWCLLSVPVGLLAGRLLARRSADLRINSTAATAVDVLITGVIAA